MNRSEESSSQAIGGGAHGVAGRDVLEVGYGGTAIRASFDEDVAGVGKKAIEGVEQKRIVVGNSSQDSRRGYQSGTEFAVLE